MDYKEATYEKKYIEAHIKESVIRLQDCALMHGLKRINYHVKEGFYH